MAPVHARHCRLNYLPLLISYLSTSLAQADFDPLVRRDALFNAFGNSGSQNTSRICKVLPGDTDWPSATKWATLSQILDGRLVQPDPLAIPCYAGQEYSASQCAAIVNNWNDSYLHINHPSSIYSPLYTGLSCLPTSDPSSGTCTLGGYPVYVINAVKAFDIQAGINFTRERNVRLVIKNTGHDFLGKSSGSGSLSIRTHLLNETLFLGEYYNRSGYTGPAFKVGAGVLALDLYKAVHNEGYVVVGGEGQTVGWAGGYVQGGGHSPLSSLHGMAADNVLGFEVVLADGELVEVDAESFPDLFWALRGGGGSTFGVVISVTVKVFPDLPVTIAQITYSTSQRDLDNFASNITDRSDFWDVFKPFMALAPQQADAGAYSYYSIIFGSQPGSLNFVMNSHVAPNSTAEAVTSSFAPMVEKAKNLNITLVNNVTAFDSFFPAFINGFPREYLGRWNTQFASRMLPRRNFDDPELFEATFNAIKDRVNEPLSYFVGIQFGATLEKGGFPDNAVCPAWRDSVLFAISTINWDPALRSLDAIEAIQQDFTVNRMKRLRDVTPGSGSYLSEGDINEPDRQQSFWGANYERLYKIKQKYDPEGVFFAETAVGSEDWNTGAHRLGRLCPNA